MSKKEKVFNILYWINILLVIFVIGILILMYKYKNTCAIALPIDKLDAICKDNSLIIYYGEHYDFIHKIFYFLISINVIISIILTIRCIMIKNIKKTTSLILILIILGASIFYNQQKIKINEWTSVTSDQN